MNRYRGERGYTLVELAVTVAIVGLLGAMAVPTFVNFLPKYRLNGAVTTLANDFNVARMTAIAKSADREIEVNPTTDAYELRHSIGGGSFATTSIAGSCDILGWNYKRALDADPTAAPVTSTVQIQLLAAGGTNVPVLEQAVYVTLATRDGSVRKRVGVWWNGRITTERWGGSAWVAD